MAAVVGVMLGSAVYLYGAYNDGKAFAPTYPRFTVELNHWSASKLMRLYKSHHCQSTPTTRCKTVAYFKKRAEDHEWREALDKVYRKIRSTSGK